MRGIFFEEEVAEAVRRQLASDGFDATVTRERFAGEDDDEDHPWAVTTDAPGIVLELLVDQYDGWLDEGDDVAAPVTPVVLPLAPKQRHRPDPEKP